MGRKTEARKRARMEAQLEAQGFVGISRDEIVKERSEMWFPFRDFEEAIRDCKSKEEE